MRVWAVVLLSLAVFAAKDPAECEVCRKVVDDVRSKLSEADRKDLVKIETTLGKFCDKPRNEKESKLCYYLDPIKREVSQPVKNGLPTDMICQRLKKKSAEICSLKYSASTASETITKDSDFSKLKISQLKAFMAEKGVSCPECIEKEDFVNKVRTHLGAVRKDL